MFKGYLFIPSKGAPVFAYAEVLATTAIPSAMVASRDPRTSTLNLAAEGAPPGLYHARMTHGSVSGAVIARGARVKGGPVSELRKLSAEARNRPKGRVVTEREATRARTARALADALRTHVLPVRA